MASMRQASRRNIDYRARAHKPLRDRLTNSCQSRVKTAPAKPGTEILDAGLR
jgi:hypothetical protein